MPVKLVDIRGCSPQARLVAQVKGTTIYTIFHAVWIENLLEKPPLVQSSSKKYCY